MEVANKATKTALQTAVPRPASPLALDGWETPLCRQDA